MPCHGSRLRDESRCSMFPTVKWSERSPGESSSQLRGVETDARGNARADQRALVQNAAAFGINQADIANQLNIDEKTLRKHFREELNSGKFIRRAPRPRSYADVLVSADGAPSLTRRRLLPNTRVELFRKAHVY